MKNQNQIRRIKRHNRIKVKMFGTKERPRLLVKRSLMNLSAQFIDDDSQRVICSFSTLDKAVKEKFKSCGNVKASETFGMLLAVKAKEKGISKIVFDRAGYLYHGRVKAFADALRKGGLVF